MFGGLSRVSENFLTCLCYCQSRNFITFSLLADDGVKCPSISQSTGVRFRSAIILTFLRINRS